MTAVATWAAFVAAAMSLVGRRYEVNYVIARTFYAVAGTALGISVEVEGEEYLDTKPALLMNNHQTMLDILFVGRLIPTRTSIISKKSLQFSPLGPFMLMAGAIFIDRGDNARAIQSLKAAGETMKSSKLSLWVFPEGTRHSSEEPDMLPLKKGGFHLAIQSGLPIVPIVTENYWRIYHKGIFESAVVKVKILPPILTAGLKPEDAGSLALQVRDQMVNALREISVKVPSGMTDKVETPPQDPPSVIPEPSDVHPELPQVSEHEEPEREREVLPSSGSNSSLADSLASSKYQMSENGTETEEDEGMVLVGRP